MSLFGGAAFGAGCGSAPTKDAAPPPVEAVVETRKPEEEPTEAPRAPELPPAERERHIADAAAEIEIAERAVEENLVKERTRPVPPRPPPPPKSPPAPNAEPKEGCERACLALSSMQSAVEHLCRLAGPTDVRCRRARLRLETATGKVVAASCGCSPVI